MLENVAAIEVVEVWLPPEVAVLTIDAEVVEYMRREQILGCWAKGRRFALVHHASALAHEARHRSLLKVGGQAGDAASATTLWASSLQHSNVLVMRPIWRTPPS